jgi:cytosine/adenosine deaminase-related metal-dependent hydrolase
VADDRLLIRGGHVLTLSASLGDFERGDVLVEGERIVAVRAEMDVADCEIIDAGAAIVMPGFVDTHRHTWQTALRGICADWTLQDYFRGIRLNISTELGPEDMYAGNYVGALEALDAGVTTLLDFSHCTNTPDHADEALRGLVEAGIRGVFAYGFYPVPVAEPWFKEHGARIEDARRVRAEQFPSPGGRLEMGVALTELGLVPLDATRREIATARELDALVTAHIGTVGDPAWPREIELLHAEKLLDARQVHVHCNACSDSELRLIAANGASVSVTPETEMQMGMGFPITGRALACGLRPGLGCDIVSLGSGDMFNQMRLGLQAQRALDNDAALRQGALPDTIRLTAANVLRLATIDGAAAMGLGTRVGSLEPGKLADILLIRTDGLRFTPWNDPVAAVVLHANAGDVDTVLVGGKVVKRGGRLLDAEAERVRRLADESRDRIMGAVEAKGGPLLELPNGWFEGVRQAVVENVGLSEN